MAANDTSPPARDPESVVAEAGAWLKVLEAAGAVNRHVLDAALVLADVRLELGSLAFIEGAGAIADTSRAQVLSAMDTLAQAQAATETMIEAARDRVHEVRNEAQVAP